MIAELDRADIINLLRGTSPCPSDEVFNEIPSKLGRWVGGNVDCWNWNIDKYLDFPEYTDEYLLELYYKCKTKGDNNGNN